MVDKSPKKNNLPWWAWVLIGIAIVIIVSWLSGVFQNNNSNSKYDDRVGDLNNEKNISIQIQILEGDNYEVTYFGYLLENSSMETAYLEMKGLGSRDWQIWEGLISLHSVYPNAPNYEVLILEPTQECDYRVRGDLYRVWTGSGKLSFKNGTQIDKNTAYSLIEYIISNPYCD